MFWLPCCRRSTWDTTWRVGRFGFGALTANWTGTYMINAEQDVPGAGAIEKSVGRFNSYNDVVFRIISRAVVTLRTSEKLMNSLTFSYRSGYHDQPLTADDAAIRVVNADGTYGALAGMVRDVDDYMTLDWQAKYNMTKNFTLTGGIKNLLDEDPPLSVRNAGGGNHVGYDGRYTDPLGRTFYLTANYKF